MAKKMLLSLASCFTALGVLATPLIANASQADSAMQYATTTPIKHVVVIFDENVSFDHYFATYPHALNLPGEPPFHALPGTPTVNGLDHELLTHNPNLDNPKRLSPSQAMTKDMDHGYQAEQAAFDGGLMDKFVQSTGHNNPIVMDYYDGNTVTGLWNYAQHFAMSDNSYGSTFGPSTPGALNLVAGQTHGAIPYNKNVAEHGTKVTSMSSNQYPNWALNQNGTLFSDVDPYYDMASKGPTIRMVGKNVGDLLNAKHVTWGWFEGGFDHPQAQSVNVGNAMITDYIPHHEPFQYYQSTANPMHLRPTSVAMIGHTDRANHQYDLTDFWSAAKANNLPAVSFLKAPGYKDGHAGYSDPLDEQRFLVNTINALQKLPTWSSTAVIISWDDSDGWYDHVMGPIVNMSNDPSQDVLVGQGNAGTPKKGTYLDRAGFGPRLPMLVISPYAKQNFVDHTVTSQSSILRFIEDNWKLGRLGNQSYDAMSGTIDNMFDFSGSTRAPKVFLNPKNGEVTSMA